jgi:hypothetical protein
MNKYINDMRAAMAEYKDVLNKATAHIEQIRQYHGEEAARREQERAVKQQEAAKAKAAAAIREAYSEGVYLATEWGKPDGSRLTDDMKLFDAGLVTPEVFDTLKQRYSNNATMLSALKVRGEKLNAEAAKADREAGGLGVMVEPYKVRDIVTPAEKLKNWEKAKAGALEALDMLDGSGKYAGGWGRAVGNAMGDQMIEHFGEGISY